MLRKDISIFFVSYIVDGDKQSKSKATHIHRDQLVINI